MKTLHLSIDRLVVEGLAPSQQRQFLTELDRRLTEFGRGDLSATVGGGSRRHRIGALDAGVLRPGAGPAQAAAQVVDRLRVAVLSERPNTARNPRGGGHV